MSTATFGLLLVGLLALTMTPDRSANPEAVASTVTLPPPRVVPATASPASTPLSIAAPTSTEPAPPEITVASTVPDVDDQPVTTTAPALPLPLVTPIGDQGYAVTTKVAIGEATSLLARLPSGQIVAAELVGDVGDVGNDDEIVIVILPASVRPSGMALSTVGPMAPTDTVVVHAAGDTDPLIVTVLELTRLDVDEGAPVTDADGNLIGICTMQPGDDDTVGAAPRTALMPIATLPEIPPTTQVGPPTSTSPTTEPEDTAPDSSVPPSTEDTVSEPDVSIDGSD